MEIERKFLMDKAPNLPVTDYGLVHQGYLSFNPEIRIRRFKKDNKFGYKLTIKGNGGLSREEIQFTLKEYEFYTLAGLINHNFVIKDFTEYQLPTGEKLEFSNVDMGAFCYAEIEFPTVEAAQAFNPPSFFGKEVTEDQYYKMKNYYQRRFPKM